MVNTFIIANTPKECAKILDAKRLGKQRVEAYQIINILSGKTEGKGWKSHPAVKMWTGHLDALKYYYNCCVKQWIKRGYKNNMELYDIEKDKIKLPWWFTWRSLQLSHIYSLIRKDPNYYNNKFNINKNEKIFMDYGYIWINDKNQALNRETKKFEYLSSPMIDTVVYCSDIGTGAPPQYRYTKEEASQWYENKNVNPKTNRSIKSSGTIYKDLQKAYSHYFG